MANDKDKTGGIVEDVDEWDLDLDSREGQTSSSGGNIEQSEGAVGGKDSFGDEPSAEEAPLSSADPIQTAVDVPVTVSAVIGQTRTTVRELLDFKQGYIIDLHRSPGETVDVVAGGKLIARGELVDMDGRLGVRILKLLR